MLLTSPLSSPLKNPARDVFSPAGGAPLSLTAQVQALFAGGKVGGMWDMGDMSTLFQDTAGSTPITAVTQPIGRVNDKSGNGNHATQPTAGSRPLYQVVGGYGCAQFDGVDDALATGAITLDSNMDCFIAVRRESAAAMIFGYTTSAGNGFFGCFTLGDSNPAVDTAGTPTLFVNGVSVPGGAATTRGQLDAAIPVGPWVLFEARNLDLSTWTAFKVGGYLGGYSLNGSIGGIVLISALSTADRNLVRTYLGSKVGLTL